MEDDELFFDYILGEWRVRDKTQTIEQTINYGGGAGSGGGTAQALVTISASEPSSGSEGELYYNTVDGSLYIYVSGVWTAISGGTPAGGSFDFIDGTEFEFVDGTYFDFIT